MEATKSISNQELSSITPAIFRRALGHFATGVTLITIDQDDSVHGMTANAFTSVSLEPPLIMVSINRLNRTHRYLQSKNRFGANILSENQIAISDYYALPSSERMERPAPFAEFYHTHYGTPVLDGALVFLECRLREMYLAGDHTLFVAEVEDIIVRSGAPLLYFCGKYRGIRRAEGQAQGGEL